VAADVTRGSADCEGRFCLLPSCQSVYCTVMVVEAVTPLAFAPIDVVPTPWVVARPPTLGAFAIVTTLAEDELQWVVSVMS
jgi:hypothetical protein